jgi:uncharacterized protein with PIN domain
MVIDTSAILPILQREPERRSLLEAIESADLTRMSVARDMAQRDRVIWTDSSPAPVLK